MKTNLARLQAVIAAATRHNDINLAVLLVMIISLMILPMPTVVVDSLIALNLSVSFILVMFSMYIRTPLDFSVFPSLLLFTTLFRLALNITTTRLILLNADAGEIIFTFGNFVVAGNFIVGAVVFLILTIVQFLVITKGSERVAEVGARFTLDAMPGKQMSIDADLRAGVIDMQEAKNRRERITKESQLYGAMDGAMKFVKGDAIAGLVITVVNILGGVMIGITQMGIPAGEAIQLFGVLSIGDALVSQIPALLISITAGIVTTRVSTEESTNLGGEIAGQLMAQPKALLLAGGLAALFALVPGFPKPQFLLLGLLIMATGYGLIKMISASKAGKDVPAYAQSLAPAAGKKRQDAARTAPEEEFSLTVPLLLDVAETMENMIPPAALNDELVSLRRALYLDLGVPFPGIHLRFTHQLQDGGYMILLQEIPMSQGRLRSGKVLVREKPDNLDLLGIPYETGERFLPNLPSLWTDESRREQLTSAGVPFMGPAQILTYHLSFVLKKNAEEFIGLQETKYLLDKMDQRFPELVKEVQRVLPIQKLAEILQRLVQEEISVRNLRTILQTLIEWGQKEKDTVLLTEYVRGGLKRYISHRFSGGQNVLAAYLLNPDVEETIRKAIRQTSAGSYLALDPNTTKKFVGNVKREAGDLTRTAHRPVLLTSMDIRRYVRKLIELEVYELPVLSYQELVQDITIQPLGRVTL